MIVLMNMGSPDEYLHILQSMSYINNNLEPPDSQRIIVFNVSYTISLFSIVNVDNRYIA